MKREQEIPEKAVSGVGAIQLRARFERVRASRHRSLLRLPEIVALAAAGALLVASVIAYLYFLVPERARLDTLGRERDSLQKQLRDATQGIKHGEDTQASVEEIGKSLEAFEANRLRPQGETQTPLIQELNALVRRNNLRSAKFTFTPLDTTATDEAQPRATPTPAQKSASRIAQNVFPGIGISLTVEGSYASLRHFIRDVEASRQFVVINTTELEDVAESTGAREIFEAAPPPPAPPGAASQLQGPLTTVPPANRAAFLSLRIDMAAYFRPANLSAMGGGALPSGTTAR